MKGQAMVEFMLILPIFLFLILGGLQLGILLAARIQLQHAVQEGAIAGASEASVPRRCDVAEATVPRVLGRSPLEVRCTAPGDLLVVTVHDQVPVVVPFASGVVDVTGRALVRR
jgi:Flp pilus assembly protein TadG